MIIIETLKKRIILSICLVLIAACKDSTVVQTEPLLTQLQLFSMISFKLLQTKQITNDVLYSPLSLYMILQLCMEGTNASIRYELKDLLHMNSTSNDAWLTLYQTMNHDHEQLQIANSLWLHNHKVLPTFEKMATRNQTDIINKDFTKVEINSQIQS